MKKVFKLEDLDCANCARKMEAILKEVIKTCKKIEPDCTVIVK